MHTIETACHVAYLDPLVGCGVLLTPMPGHDLTVDSVSLHEADWDNMISQLHEIGWIPNEDERGGVLFIGDARDGRAGYSLVALDPIDSDPAVEIWTEAQHELERVAGLLD